MLIEEFEEKTGFHPTIALYEEIEKRYRAENIDKDEFCRKYKYNVDGIAEAIRWAADLKAVQKEKQMEQLKERLEKELGWVPVEMSKMTQSQYARLRGTKGTKKLEAWEAAEWIEKEFGFSQSLIKIHSEIETYQISRAGYIRENGTVSRWPMYFSTEWNYVRFSIKGWEYEIVNGEIYRYYKANEHPKCNN